MLKNNMISLEWRKPDANASLTEAGSVMNWPFSMPERAVRFSPFISPVMLPPFTCRPDLLTMKKFARKFYSSQRWVTTREAYKHYRGGLCERCYANGILSPGELVHHKIHLTPDNINDPNITLSWNNLELLCRKCHRAEHDADIPKLEPKRRQRRYEVDESGRVKCLNTAPL